MKEKVKFISLLLVVLLLSNMIMPTMNVFATTTKNIKITSEGVRARVVFTNTPNNIEERIDEYFVDEENPIDIKDKTDGRFTGDIYVAIEPDIFTGGKITSIKINGESKDIEYPTGRNIYLLPETDSYNIEIEGAEEKHYTIMWANEGANVEGTDFDDEEILLKNGTAKIIKVYDNEQDMNDISEQIGDIDEGCVDPEGKGYVSLSEGNVIIFEFVPKYGYQLTSVSANGSELEAQDTVNQYKYIMPDTNIHFQATFTKTDDVVKSSTSKVTNGTITMSNNEIESGTAVLSVKDANLTDSQKESFKTKAGEYIINNVFDIKLDQVFYKGNSNTSDVWSNPLGSGENLKKPVAITLKLDETMDGDEIVLVHEKHNGEYEIIDTTYDKANNTVSFETLSFSNYAIASKNNENTSSIEPENNDNSQTVETKTEEPKSEVKEEKAISNPQTGDNIVLFAIIAIIALVGIIFTIKLKNKKNKKNNY